MKIFRWLKGIFVRGGPGFAWFRYEDDNHVIDPERVRQSVEKNISAYENKRSSGQSILPDSYIEWVINRERERYSTVTIIQRSDGFFLSYVNETRGTGPFDTFEKAADWFYSGGR